MFFLLFVTAALTLPKLAELFAASMVLSVSSSLFFGKLQWRNLGLVAASLTVSLSVVEFASEFVPPKRLNAEVDKAHQPSTWMLRDPVLGQRPQRGIAVSAVASWRGEEIYARTYTINADGSRLTPNSGGGEPTFVFIGDSFIFGEGLADDQTLPAQFAREIHSSARVVNLGVLGYGPNQLVRALETGSYDSYTQGSVAAVVTWIIPEQLARVTGDASWLDDAPRYVLIPDGSLEFTGSFRQYRWKVPTAALEHWARENLHSVLLICERLRLREKERSDLYVALIRRLNELVHARFNAPLVLIYLWPEKVSASGDNTALVSTLDAISRLHIPMVQAIDWDQRIAFSINHDMHPSALLDKKVALQLKSHLGL